MNIKYLGIDIRIYIQIFDRETDEDYKYTLIVRLCVFRFFVVSYHRQREHKTLYLYTIMMSTGIATRHLEILC